MNELDAVFFLHLGNYVAVTKKCFDESWNCPRSELRQILSGMIDFMWKHSDTSPSTFANMFVVLHLHVITLVTSMIPGEYGYQTFTHITNH